MPPSPERIGFPCAFSMDNIFGVLILFALGLVLGLAVSSIYMQQHYRDPMDALGIEKFQKCEIHTTNCHSNWYEIVYKKDR